MARPIGTEVMAVYPQAEHAWLLGVAIAGLILAGCQSGPRPGPTDGGSGPSMDSAERTSPSVSPDLPTNEAGLKSEIADVAELVCLRIGQADVWPPETDRITIGVQRLGRLAARLVELGVPEPSGQAATTAHEFARTVGMLTAEWFTVLRLESEEGPQAAMAHLKGPAEDACALLRQGLP